MYVVLGGGYVISSEEILMIANLRKCGFEIPEGMVIEETQEDITPRTLIITVDGRGIYTNSTVSTILKRIRKWGRVRNG
ncbi:MAG: hypothetical protein H5U01_09740 [Clostridia bacterium]|nr:MAG: hypothetical protein XD52_0163 [bacterium 42_11]MBC7332684.1 hypothetical protein [Synergistota bacterium]MBC7336538.1 hypothetical protein [Clostridia bacterium]